MLKVDLHIHTVASQHAFNTILEYINHAKELKMEVIGISDHGPDIDTTLTDETYFRSMDRIPERINGIRVLRGVEANIVNFEGDIDLSEKAIKKLDYVMANFHRGTSYKDGGKEKNTQAIINTIQSGKIDIITHPHFMEIGETDRIRIYEEACKNNVLLELNLSHLLPRKIKEETANYYKEIVDVVRKYKQKIIIGSDAHVIWELGDETNLKKIKKEIGLTDDMIINNYPKELFKILEINE